MVDILESRSSPNYEKRKVIAKGLARKYNLKIIYIKDRMLDVPTYDFSVTYKKNGVTLFGSSMRMQTKFYKKDLI